jgi:hypothetical protein
MPYPRHLLAVDPSLTCSGWALFRVIDCAILGVGNLRALPPHHVLPERLADLQRKVLQTLERCDIGDDDVVVCEMPTTMRDPNAATKVEQVRAMFEVLSRLRGAQVPGRINPRSIHHELLGMRGAQKKRDTVKASAVEVARSLFGQQLAAIGFDATSPNLGRNQDIVDALLVGHLAVTRIRSAVLAGAKITELFAPRGGRRRGVGVGS